MYFTERPFEWVDWVKTIRTEQQLALIKSRARTVTKFSAKDREALNRDLRAKTKALQ